MHKNGREPRVLLGDQTRVEFRALIESQRTQIGIVPVAATEQHLHHLDMSTDCTEIEFVTRTAARRVAPLAVITPTVSVGVSEHHMKHPGSLTSRWEIFTEYVFDHVESLARGGLGKIVVLNGHGGNTRPETPTWNVVIVTTGIARRWFQGDLISGHNTLVVDEIHQTSAELELCLALGKRLGCRFIWLSATVDPAFYAEYLGSRDVLETSAFDPQLAAAVEVRTQSPVEFLYERFLRRVQRERRGVAVFLPTRAEVEAVAVELGDAHPGVHTAIYHGGEPIRVIRPFLEGAVEKPFLLAMTAAGQSALNITRLDTVVIYDARDSDLDAIALKTVERRLANNQLIPGIGHGIHTGGDPRADRLFEIAQETKTYGRNCELLKKIGKIADQKVGKHLPANVTGAIAAISQDMGFHWQMSKSFAILGRALGGLAHVGEEIRRPIARGISNLIRDSLQYEPEK